MRKTETVYVGGGLLGSVWILATLLLFINWFVKSIPSWIVDVCNIIFLIGIFVPVILIVGFIFIILIVVAIDHRRI